MSEYKKPGSLSGCMEETHHLKHSHCILYNQGLQIDSLELIQVRTDETGGKPWEPNTHARFPPW